MNPISRFFNKPTASEAVKAAVEFYESTPTWYLAHGLRSATKNETTLIKFVLDERGVSLHDLKDYPMPEVIAKTLA